MPSTLAPSASATTVLGNRGTSYAIPGKVYTIAEARGKVAGTNLFHSFESFSVGSGDAAVFTTTTATLQNVINRMSGSSPTTIEGLLALLPAPGSNPNFFFINPAGVTFGAGAQVDVPAALHVSTANHLHFADGMLFKAGNASDSMLTVAAPDAFGFVGATRATIAVTSGTVLQPSPGARLSVVAGDVEISQGLALAEGGGDVRVVAVGPDVGAIPLSGPPPAVHGALKVVNGGGIVTTSLADHDSGNVVVGAGDITVDGEGSGARFTGISSVAPLGYARGAGNVTIAAARKLSVRDGGLISSQSCSIGSAGAVAVTAHDMTLEGQIDAVSVDIEGVSVQTGVATCACVIGGPGSAGSLAFTVTNKLSILNGARIFSNTGSTGPAGSIKIRAGSVLTDEQESNEFTGIEAQSNGSGRGADVDVSVAGRLSILNGAAIAASAFSTGNAGTVKVSAQSIDIDEQTSPYVTGLFSTARIGSSGNAGDIHVHVAGHLSVANGAAIASDTWATGAGGSVSIDAQTMTIDGEDSDYFTLISSEANPGASGDAGHVDVRVQGDLIVLAGALINSSNYGSTGRAGSLKVSAGNILIDGRGEARPTGIASTSLSSGSAGNVDVSASGTLVLLNSGAIAASTDGAGNAGSVRVSAENIRLDGQDETYVYGIQSFALSTSSGNAGDVIVSARENLSVLGGNFISASTFSATGRSGAVRVNAGTILVDGTFSEISAQAREKSSGQTGSLTVEAKNGITLSHDGRLSIQNDATVANPNALIPTLLSVSAPNVSLASGGQITAESTGNVAASDIRIDFAERLMADPSSITTNANQGNGGDITIRGGRLLWLDHSQMTTSVTGASGNGGDISIRAGTLVMETGFIQANTAGRGASGGNVSIDVQTLLASGGTLFVAGSTPALFEAQAFGLNVIQAAAPTGVSGRIGIAAPVLDIAGELSGLEAKIIDVGPLGRDLCRVGSGSSLTPVGRGGLRPSAAGLIRPETSTAEQTQARRAAGSVRLAQVSAADCRDDPARPRAMVAPREGR